MPNFLEVKPLSCLKQHSRVNILVTKLPNLPRKPAQKKIYSFNHSILNILNILKIKQY